MFTWKASRRALMGAIMAGVVISGAGQTPAVAARGALKSPRGVPRVPEERPALPAAEPMLELPAPPERLALPPPQPERPKQLPHPADPIVCNQPLGALYTPQQTTFRVWAPMANQVVLHTYTSPVGGVGKTVQLSKNQDGSWETTVPGDCNGLYYTYSAAGDDPGFHPEKEVVDPYAECCTAADGRGMVVADRTSVAPRPKFPPQDAIVYEMHLRDFTADPDGGVQRRGRYLGLTEGGTHLFMRPDISTGLDHLSELGINTVQLMPIEEFTNDKKNDAYGWGYDPALYNTPDGSYTSERLDASRVTETRQMIDALHRRGIRVVLDIVFNHLDEGFREKASAFEALVPGYYIRRKLDGTPWNGSACGNEFRSEAPMARRFIKDTVKHWVTEYGADGFRFDLMGLIDVETMKELTAELHAIDPNLLVYGEPWAAGETPIEVTSKGMQKGLGFGCFNDHFRDAMRGSVFQRREEGYLAAGNHEEQLREGIEGSIDDFTQAPTESINYIECHDNDTLWDRLKIETADDSTVTDADRRAMDKLGAAVLLTSQGIPFIQSGQEFLRSKFGDDNSYNKPDSVNMLRWDQKLQNQDVFEYYRGLIALRKAHPMFRLPSGDQVRMALSFLDPLPDKVVGYVLNDVTGQDAWQRATVLFNADAQPQQVHIPSGQWQLYVDGMHAGAQPRGAVPGDVVTIPPRTALVLGEAKAQRSSASCSAAASARTTSS
ncbi:MAG: type I pullulanase [Candidatus Xenobia bacterium]